MAIVPGLNISSPEAGLKNTVFADDNGFVTRPWLQWFLSVYRVLLLIKIGSGNPNTTVTASPPCLYLNILGGAGTTLYVKESGKDTNTGWVGK